MSIRYATFSTALLLGAMLVAGSVMTAHAGDGCTKDQSQDSSSSAAYPTVTLQS
jgi:hypothetical protein